MTFFVFAFVCVSFYSLIFMATLSLTYNRKSIYKWLNIIKLTRLQTVLIKVQLRGYHFTNKLQTTFYGGLNR